MCAVAASAGAPAMAQDQAASSSSPAAVQEVIVTGSRIQSTNLVSISPVTTVTATDIEQTGLVRTEDILNNLPQIFAGQGSTLSNASDGTSTVDLHDLGPQRTLVLVNGRRLGPGAADGRNFSDINQIPAALIEKIEVLTGGASATYGADAVSGVVNFIMNTHFQGVKLDADYGMYQHHNHDSKLSSLESLSNFQPTDSSVDSGFTKQFSFIAGSNFADGAGNATMYTTYNNEAAVTQRPFDYSACTLSGKVVSGKTALSCGGSGTNAGGQFIGYDAAGNTIIDHTVDPKTGIFRPNTAADAFNYGALNYYQRPNERWTSGAFLDYDVNSHVNVYSELMFTRNTSTSQIAPSGDFGNAATISCANPLLTAQELSVLCSPANLAAQAPGTPANSIQLAYILRRNVEGGNRQEAFTTTSYRTLIGVKGDFADAWRYDAFASFNTLSAIASNLNYLSNTRINNALNVVAGPGGVPTCQSVIDGTDPNCVPWNIWVPGQVTKAATNYMSIPLIITGGVNEYNVEASVTGDLGKYGVQLPTAKSGVQFNFGSDWREDESHFDPDLASELGEGAGGAGPQPPIKGQIHVAEVFTEFNVPLIDDKPGAQQLAFDGGYRYSSYNLGFKTNTFKLGLEWAPITDIRFRGSFNRAVRAPDVAELYTSPAVGPGGTVDPCWGTAPTLTLAQCELTGVTAQQYGHLAVNSATQINTLAAGNAKLTPERADTFSVGFVFQPEFLPGFTGSVDYYDIKIKNAILNSTGIGTALVLGCAEFANAEACSKIHRATNGSLWLSTTGYVDTTAANVGEISTRDVDVKTHYTYTLPTLGKLAFNLEGSAVLDNKTVAFTGAPSYNCAGFYGTTCNNPLPKWRHTLSTDWITPWSGLDFNVRWRFFGSSKVDTSSGDAILAYAPGVYPAYDHIPTYSYIDMSASAHVYQGLSVRVGVNNVLDKDPPTVLSGNCPAGPCNGNTWSQTYDVLGRFLYVHLTAQF
jgi:outer membrane receptor protein involved in Fe transport